MRSVIWVTDDYLVRPALQKHKKTKTLTTQVSGRWSLRSKVNVSYDWLRRRAVPRRRLTWLVDINDGSERHDQCTTSDILVGLMCFKRKLLLSAWHLQLDRQTAVGRESGWSGGVGGFREKAKSKRGGPCTENAQDLFVWVWVCVWVCLCCGGAHISIAASRKCCLIEGEWDGHAL